MRRLRAHVGSASALCDVTVVSFSISRASSSGCNNEGTMPATSTVARPDSPEVRRYNRVRRWLGIGEFALGLALLLVLLLIGWTGWLRDLAYRGAFQSYALAV